jgi:MSHA biogenesis protein MshL
MSQYFNPGTSRRLLASAMMIALAACTPQPLLKQSESHITPPPAETQGSIPAPVAITTALPKPKAVQRPETYSVVVNNVKVQELLFALARDAKVNVDVHPGINGTVTMNAIDQSLPQLLTRLSKQVDMRWEYDPPNLIVMPDIPFLRIYKIDYVNMERSATGSVGVSSQISAGGAGGGGGGGGTTGGGNTSSTILRSSSINKFWETLVENVKDILRETDKVVPTSTEKPAATPPAVAGSGGAAAPSGIAGAVASAILGGGGAGGQQGAAAAPVVTPPPANQSPNTAFREAASVIANAEAGVLSIRATGRQHEKIQEFLDRVMVNAKRQVLIEATIVEVQLSNQFQQGINWSLLRRGPSGINITQAPVGGLAASPTQGLFVGNLAAPSLNIGNLSATIQLLEAFGNVRVLSSPRLSVLNNQTALLKVVDERVYFTIQASTTANQTTSQTTFTTTPNVVPVGFVMNVTPQIGDTDSVLLNVRPSLSRIVSFVNDPNPTLANPCGVPVPAGGCTIPAVVSRIPEIQRREMESLLKINSGQIAVMGGLIQDSVNDLEDSVPGLRSQEGIGALFGQRTRTNTKTELVVFLRPVVIKDASIDGDFRAYRVLAPDENFINQANPSLPPIVTRP